MVGNSKARSQPRDEEVNSKAELDAADEGGEPVLDRNYPPRDEPLYWEEFKEWAAVNVPDYSLAVINNHVADPVMQAALQSYRAGRTATRYGHPAGTQGLMDFRKWASTNLHIQAKDPRGQEIAEHAFLAGSLKH
jgi:hypothetical protein